MVVKKVADDDELLKASEICAWKKISQNTFYRQVAAGLIPPGERVGLRGVRWRRSLIDAAYNAMTHAQRRVPIGTGLDHEGTASVEVAARWLALEPSPPRPVVPALKERFGLTALQACEATALAFDLRAGGGAA